MVKDKSKHFFERIVCCWRDDEFKDNIRLSRATFVYLCSQLAPCLQKHHCVREPLSVELRVAVTLWRLGSNAEYRISVWCWIIHSVCCCKGDMRCNCRVVVASLYIRVLTGDCLHDAVERFSSRCGFPQCVDAIDGAHAHSWSLIKHRMKRMEQNERC